MVVADKKERLTLDVIGQLEEELEENPFNHAKWAKLIEHVTVKDKEDQVRTTFDKYLSLFKFDAKQWSNYINFELNRGDFSRVEKLFAKCLVQTTDVDICRTYVLYVRRVNDVITGGEKARNTVVQAFDFAVNKVGIDLESYDLWRDYLDFFKSWTPGSSWEQQQKNDLIRKLYRRCLVIPTSKIETLWMDYTKWENDVSTPHSASKFIADLSTSYMEARSWNTEWHHNTKDSIRKKIVSASPSNDPNEFLNSQIALWYLWIDLEEKNSLHLDDSELQRRIEYVYKRATSILPFVPEIWYRYCLFLLKNDSNRPACIELLNDSLLLNPKSFLLTFKCSELYEKDVALEKAQGVIQTLIKHLVEEHKAIEDKVQNLKGATDDSKLLTPDEKNESDDENGDGKSSALKASGVIYSEADALLILKGEDKLQELSKTVTLAYIKLMSLCKRSQGVKEVRSIFKQRKSFKSMGFEFYVENALIEFYSDNKKTADKIFDLAMKSFGKDGRFLHAYLEYLILTNAIGSIKVFFEVAITNLLKETSADKEALQVSTINILDRRRKLQRLNDNEFYMKKIIKKYITFASRFLDLDTVDSLEKRYLQYFPEEDELNLFSDRYKVGTVDAIAKYDMGDIQAFSGSDADQNNEASGSGRSNKRRKIRSTDNYSPETSGQGSTFATSSRNSPFSVPSKPIQSQQPLHGFVGQSIYNLLLVLPNAGYFGPPSDHVFNSAKLVELFANMSNLPGEI